MDMINMQVANTSTDGEELEVIAHPDAGGTDIVILKPGTAYVMTGMDQTTHFQVQPHAAGVEANVVTVETAVLVSPMPGPGDPDPDTNFNPFPDTPPTS